VAISPHGANTSDFLWRVSVAEVSRAGPFSAFPGVDRHLLLLSGAGVRLSGPSITTRHVVLDRPLQPPFFFAGEAHIDAELLGGTSCDFNVMTRRGLARADVVVFRGTEAGGAQRLAACDALVLLALKNAWRVSQEAGAASAEGKVSLSLAEGAGAVARGGVPEVTVEAEAVAGALVAVRILLEGSRDSNTDP
jgi:environmental stress-induced protein Ves